MPGLLSLMYNQSLQLQTNVSPSLLYEKGQPSLPDFCCCPNYLQCQVYKGRCSMRYCVFCVCKKRKSCNSLLHLLPLLTRRYCDILHEGNKAFPYYLKPIATPLSEMSAGCEPPSLSQVQNSSPCPWPPSSLRLELRDCFPVYLTYVT